LIIDIARRNRRQRKERSSSRGLPQQSAESALPAGNQARRETRPVEAASFAFDQ